jgi:V8-like Glu-specific endopeptidase
MTLFFLLLLVGCKFVTSQSDEASEIKFLNENSRRRLATAAESASIFRLKTYGGNTCTAFAVQNADKRPIIMTARHCMNYTAKDWCQKVGEIKSADGNVTYNCKEIIFDPQDSDFAAMELDKQIPSEGYMLANFDPAGGRRLQMIGFPADWYGKSLGGTVVTENCWMANSVREPANVDTIITPHPDALSHNCATYGGNSGGPMLSESTNLVVGLPASFWRSEKIRSSYETAKMYPTIDMLKKHKDFIISTKIKTADYDLIAAPSKEFMSRSKCSSATMKTQIDELLPIYSSEAEYTALKIKFKGFGWLLFRCTNENICNERTNDSGETIKIKSSTEITYTKNGISADFTCEIF